MFGIELTTGTKIQIAVILVILSAAGFMLLRNSKKQMNDAVNSWIEPIKVLKTGSRTEWDPVKEGTNNVFSCVDGKLSIIEYKNDPSRKPTISWAIDKRRTEFLYYRDPMARVTAIKDPFRHAISLAAYSAANGTSLGFLGSAALTKEQIDAEKAAREVMNDELKLINGQIEDGTFKMDLFNKVMQVLGEYKRVKGNPTTDQPKAEAARTVIQTANDFLNAVEEARSISIEKYISKVTGILTADQKQKVIAAAKAYQDAKNPKLAGTVRRVAPAAPGGAVNGRGGATPASGPRQVAPAGPARQVTPGGRAGTGNTPARGNTNTPARVAPPAPGVAPEPAGAGG